MRVFFSTAPGERPPALESVKGAGKNKKTVPPEKIAETALSLFLL
jgi:hypothetical protein